MQKFTSLTWATPEALEFILWVWVALGAGLILERLLLFAMHCRPGLAGRLWPFSKAGLSREQRYRAIAWFVQNDIKAYREFLERYGEIATALGMAGTLVSLMASGHVRSESKDLFPLLVIALRTTLVGIFAAVVVTVVFGNLLWPRMQETLVQRWKSAAEQLKPRSLQDRPTPGRILRKAPADTARNEPTGEEPRAAAADMANASPGSALAPIVRPLERREESDPRARSGREFECAGGGSDSTSPPSRESAPRIAT